MLSWFKKKFSQKEAEEKTSPADLKIPVAPRDFGAPQQPPEPEKPIAAPLDDAEAAQPVQEEHELDDQAAVTEESSTEQESQPSPQSEEAEITVSPVGEAAQEPEPEEAAAPLPAGSEDELTAAHTPELETAEADADTAADQRAPIEEPATSPQQAVCEEIADEPEETAIVEKVELESVPEPEIDAVKEPDESPAAAIEQESKEAEKTAPDLSEKIPVAAVRTPVEPIESSKKSAEKGGFFTRLTEKLSRTREGFTYQLDTLFLGKKEIDADLLDDLEELLITADLGVSTTEEILDHARRKVKRDSLSDPSALKDIIKDKLKSFITDYQEDPSLVMPESGPFVIMVVGVNGVGKTTTIGKIAHKFINSGQSVLLVAADTFRAAAISQLKIWGERNNVPVISQNEGADPSSVVYDGIAHAKAKDYDVVLVDTAGRLHTQANLMEELKKIKRVMGKQLAGAPHEVMLVVDATTGQNGISQAKLFDAAVELTGITLTKLDGTAKGGIVANICKELKTPIRFIGVGEQLEDLRDFDPDEFIDALFQSRDAEER